MSDGAFTWMSADELRKAEVEIDEALGVKAKRPEPVRFDITSGNQRLREVVYLQQIARGTYGGKWSNVWTCRASSGYENANWEANAPSASAFVSHALRISKSAQ